MRLPVRPQQQHGSYSLSQSASSSPYYSKASFTPFMPLAVLYSFLSRAILRIVGTSNVSSSSTSHRLLLSLDDNDHGPPFSCGSVIRDTPDVPELFPTEEGVDNENHEAPIAVVTGSNTGIGYETAKALVHRGYIVVLACRSIDKATEAAHKIHADLPSTCPGRAVVLPTTSLDLGSLASVRNYCREFRKQYPQLHVLINNAGTNRAPSPSSSDDDEQFDTLFQANFLGHYVLTCGLLDSLLAVASSSSTTPNQSKPPRRRRKARIVNVSSVMHHFNRGADLESESYWKTVLHATKPGTDANAAAHATKDSYSLSKLAAILFTLQLNVSYGDCIDSIAVNPGSVYVHWRKMSFFVRLGSAMMCVPEPWHLSGVFGVALRCVRPSLESSLSRCFAVPLVCCSTLRNILDIRNSDIWRGYPRWLVFLFQLVYLTPRQGCRTSVLAATATTIPFSLPLWGRTDASSKTKDDTTLGFAVPYLQPYRYWSLRGPWWWWRRNNHTLNSSTASFSSGASSGTSNLLPRPMHPVCEMLGPYEGCVVTPPRLPLEGGRDASNALWEACASATKCQWSPPKSSGAST